MGKRYFDSHTDPALGWRRNFNVDFFFLLLLCSTWIQVIACQFFKRIYTNLRAEGLFALCHWQHRHQHTVHMHKAWDLFVLICSPAAKAKECMHLPCSHRAIRLLFVHRNANLSIYPALPACPLRSLCPSHQCYLALFCWQSLVLVCCFVWTTFSSIATIQKNKQEKKKAALTCVKKIPCCMGNVCLMLEEIQKRYIFPALDSTSCWNEHGPVSVWRHGRKKASEAAKHKSALLNAFTDLLPHSEIADVKSPPSPPRLLLLIQTYFYSAWSFCQTWRVIVLKQLCASGINCFA